MILAIFYCFLIFILGTIYCFLIFILGILKQAKLDAMFSTYEDYLMCFLTKHKNPHLIFTFAVI